MKNLEDAYKDILNRYELIFGIRADNTLATSILDWMDFSIEYDKEENKYSLSIERLLYFETKDDAIRFYTYIANQLKLFIVDNYPTFDFSTVGTSDDREMNTRTYIEFVSEHFTSDDLFDVFRFFLTKININ